MKRKIKQAIKKQDWLYLAPRIIIIGYPAIIVGQAFIYTVLYSFSSGGFLITCIAALLCTAIVYMCLKLQLLGGLTLIFIGTVIIVGASFSDIGFDWRGVFLGGLPLFAAGVLFIRESKIKRQEALEELQLRKKTRNNNKNIV
jgi:hypothetical protein